MSYTTSPGRDAFIALVTFAAGRGNFLRPGILNGAEKSRQYGDYLTDVPGVSGVGPPVALGWTYGTDGAGLGALVEVAPFDGVMEGVPAVGVMGRAP